MYHMDGFLMAYTTHIYIIYIYIDYLLLFVFAKDVDVFNSCWLALVCRPLGPEDTEILIDVGKAP